MADPRKDLTKLQAREIWIQAQRLNTATPFGDSIDATRSAIEHLGYVQIDTINVIERCHHHILFNRIPSYQRADLVREQRDSRSVFEYWTHALSYIPVRDFRFYGEMMASYRRDTSRWYHKTTPAEVRRVLKTIEREGAVTIRDMNDEVLVEKTHPWASKKPSKKALEVGFYSGQLVISERIGMLKRYELTLRHFGWTSVPRRASAREQIEYRIDRAIRAQGVVSLDSIAYLIPRLKPDVLRAVRARVRRGELVEVAIAGVKDAHWMRAEDLDAPVASSSLVHILSPFDPLVIQRRRLKAFFGYEHKFEAYVPAAKRVYGYFALPVLMDNEIVAVLDLKTDRQNAELLVQKWTWLKPFKSRARKARIEEALHAFERFQLQIGP